MHNSSCEYVNKSTFVLTSLRKELRVNLLEGFFINNTTGAFLGKVARSDVSKVFIKGILYSLNRVDCYAKMHEED